MKCTVCGMELREGAVFCGNCGSKIEQTTELDFTKEEENGVLTVEGDELIRLLQETISQINKLVQVLQRQRENDDKAAGTIQALTKELAEKDATMKQMGEQIEALQKSVADLEDQLSKKTCPGCGNSITEEMRYCNVCGLKLRE